MKLKVEYLFNSGFTIETENRFLVFDYYLGELKIPDGKELIFFVSHSHADHYNPSIFKYRDRASYLLSFDLYDLIEARSENIVFMDIDEKISFKGLEILALGSTDEGVSFYLDLDGLRLFHSGDLNWWAWEDEGPEVELEREAAFKLEIDKLEGLPVDIAFVPVDPRLMHNFHLAGAYVIEKLRPGYFFPMHFGDKFESNRDFIHKLGTSSTEIVNISRRNQVFYLDVD